MRQARSEVYPRKAGVLRLTRFRAPARRIGRLNPARRHAVTHERSRLTDRPGPNITRTYHYICKLFDTYSYPPENISHWRQHNASRVILFPIVESNRFRDSLVACVLCLYLLYFEIYTYGRNFRLWLIRVSLQRWKFVFAWKETGKPSNCIPSTVLRCTSMTRTQRTMATRIPLGPIRKVSPW